MANGICDICGIRPATVRAQVVRNGQRETLELCDVDYRRLARQQSRSSSPLESLFGGRGGGLLDDFFNDDFFAGRGLRGGEETEDRPAGGTEIPVRRGAGRSRGGATGDTERLSAKAEEILQAAAREAAEAGRRAVDTEHLLLALTESDIVRTILDQFKVSVDDLRHQIERESRRGDGAREEGGEIGVSPRVKDALSRAFRASAEFGHSTHGPRPGRQSRDRRLARRSPRRCRLPAGVRSTGAPSPHPVGTRDATRPRHAGRRGSRR